MDLSDYACVIPSKGTSRRIPHKNVSLFYGRPLFVWSVIHARAVGLEDVAVITDTQEIACVAEDNGCGVVFEPEGGFDAAGHAVEWAVAQKLIPDKHVITLLPTQPLRDLQWILTMIDMHRTGHWLVVSVAYDCTGYLCTKDHRPIWPPGHTPTKPIYMADMPKLYRGGGGLSLCDKGVFAMPGGPAALSGGPRHGLLLLPKKEAIRCIDLDDPEDWLLGEAMAAVLDGKVE